MIGDFDNQIDFRTLPSTLLEADSSVFKDHLKSRSSEISAVISQLFRRGPSAVPEVTQLQGRIAELLATEKGHIVELEKSRLEKEKLLDRLEDASLRYMLAEKKLDRSKSATVAKLEKQAIAGGRSETGSGLGGSNQDTSNGQSDSMTDSKDGFQGVEEARKEAMVESAKRKEQLESLEVENGKLTAEITNLTNRLSHLSDDDYSKSDLFKQLRSQHEDVIKRINDLEATNVQLREEAQRLQVERTAYRVQIEKESRGTLVEKESQLVQLETDLTRIRSARDELIADQSMRKTAQSQERIAIDQIKELANAKEERVKALESEIARLKIQSGDPRRLMNGTSNSDDLSTADLQVRYGNLEKQYSLLNNELQSMESAFKRTSNVAQQKLNNVSLMEEKMVRLSAEKARADQKYFAAMKAKEAREQEIRSLRAQNSKSSDMVSSLKDSEAANRALQINLEKQIVELKDSVITLEIKSRSSQQQLSEKNILLEGLKGQVEELKKNLEAKDTSSSTTSTTFRKAEVEIETLKVRLEETKKNLESWKTRGLGNQSGEYEMLRVSFSQLTE